MLKEYQIDSLSSMFSKKLFYFMLSTFILTVCANEKASKLMREYQQSIINLSQYFNKLEDFESPDNKEFIIKNLKHLNEITKKAQKHHALNNNLMQIPLKSLEKHFDKTLQDFQVGRKKMAFWRLNSSLQACNQCHSHNVSIEKKNRKKTKLQYKTSMTHFNRAKLFFVFRSYDKAKQEFKHILYHSNSASFEWESALDSFMYIMLKVEKKPMLLLKELQSLHNIKTVNSIQKNTIKIWIDEVQHIVNNKNIKSNLDSYISFVYPFEKKGFSKKVRMIHLMNIVESQDSSAENLYWLGLSHIELDASMFFSFGEEYLKKCIKKYVKSKFSKKCYDVLSEHILLGYTGSAGTDIPVEIQNELNELKSSIKY